MTSCAHDSLNAYTRIKLLHVKFYDKLRKVKCGLSTNFHTPEYEPEKSQRGNVFLLCFIMTKTITCFCKIQDILTKSDVNDVFLLPSTFTPL